MRPSRVGAALGLALLSAVLAPPPAAQSAPLWDQTASAPKTLVFQPCTDQLFVGVRGGDEPAPLGPTVDRVRAALAEKVPLRTRVTFVDYPSVSPRTLTEGDLGRAMLAESPASAAYERSVRAGATELGRILTWSTMACPGQRVILVGHAQGAQVITAALAAGAPRSSVRATVLMGSPVHYPGQEVQELDGTASSTATGVVSALAFLRDRAQAQQGNRRAAVHTLVAQAFRVYEGKVSGRELAGPLREAKGVLPGGTSEASWSVCLKDDLTCDAAPAMSRVLTADSTFEKEYARAGAVQRGYTPQAMPHTMAAVSARLTGAPPPQRPAPQPSAGSTSAAPAPTAAGATGTAAAPDSALVAVERPQPPSRAFWGAGITGVVVLAVASLVLGRRRRP